MRANHHKIILSLLLALVGMVEGNAQISAPAQRHIQLSRFFNPTLPEAQDIASGRDGSVAIISGLQYTTTSGNLITFFDRNQNFSWEFNNPSFTFRALAIESDSAIWISGTGTGSLGNTLEKRDKNGNALVQMSVSGGLITHMVTDSAGNLFAFNPGGLMKITPQGNLIWAKSYSGFPALTRIIYNPNHTLSVVSAERVMMLDLDGNVLFSKYVTGGIVLIYPDRSIAIASYGNYHVVKYDSSGNLLWSVGVSGFYSSWNQGLLRAAADINGGGVMLTYDQTYSVQQQAFCGGPFTFYDYGYIYLDRFGEEKSGDLSHGYFDHAFIKVLKEDVNGDILLSESNYSTDYFNCYSRPPALACGYRWVFPGTCPNDPPVHQVNAVPPFGSIQPYSVTVSSAAPTFTPFSVVSNPYLNGLAISACCSKPRIDFSFVQQANAFQFTSDIFNQDSLWWNFGDGSMDSVAHPAHTFGAQADSFLVCLYAENSCGVDSFCRWVKPCSTVLFTASATEACVGDSVFLTNNSDSGFVFNWFDNGSLFSTDSDAVWLPGSPGLHSIVLTGDNGVCQSGDSTSIQVYAQPPLAGFSFTNANLALSFSDTSQNATSWSWDFGDGATSTLQNPTHTYSANGTYTICQIATNPCGADTICSVFSCNAPDAEFGIYQYLDSISLTDSSAYAQSWHWDFGDGATDTVQNPTHIYSQTGIYFITLKIENPCGTDSITHPVTIFVPNSGVNMFFNRIIEFDTTGTTATAIAETPDEGFIMVGHRGSPNNAFVCKLDGIGNVLWAREMGGNSDTEFATRVMVTSDHNYVVAGNIPTGAANTFLMKISPQGNLLWLKTFGGPGFEYPTAITEVDSGFIVVAGTIGSGLADKAFCFRVDSLGNLDWETVIDKGSHRIAAKAMDIDQDGNIILAIEKQGSPSVDIFLMKLDPASGSEIYTVRLDASIAIQNIAGMTILPSGEIVVCLNEDASYYNWNNPGNYISPYFYKFDFPDSIPVNSAIGVTMKGYNVRRALQGYPNNSLFPYEVQKLTTTSTGKILAIGTLKNALNNDFAGFFGFGEEMMMMKMNADLSLDWDMLFARNDHNTGVDALFTSTGNLLTAGNTAYYRPGSVFPIDRINLYRFANVAAWTCNYSPYNPFFILNSGSLLSNVANHPPAFAFSSGIGPNTSTSTLNPISETNVPSCLGTCTSFPTADFGFSLSAQTATFSDSSAGTSSYYWDFGDGNSSTQANPVHTFTPGTYQVCLTVANSCGTNSLCQTITVNCPFPVANFSGTTSQLTATFADSSQNASNWLWDFGDGNGSTLQNPTHVYSACGSYNVCLIADNACSSDTFCAAVTVSFPAPVSVFGFQDSLYQVSFSDSSQNAISWHWDFGDGDTSSAQHPVHIYPANGTYQACLITENICGQVDTACQTITVNCPFPVANFSGTTSQLTATFADSSQNASNWLWDFGDGNGSTLQNPTHVYSACGSYNVCLIADNACSSDTFCTAVTISFPPPVSVFGFQDSLYQVSFSDSSQNALSWHWDFGDGDTSSAQHPVHIYPVNGTYQACLITENFCGQLDTACQTITVNCPFPVANFSGTTSQLTATFADSSQNASNWLWDFGDGNGSTLQNPTHVYSACGSYNVCLIADNACSSDTFCAAVTVSFPAPVSVFGFQDSLYQVSFSDSSQNALSWHWDFGDGDTSSAQHPVHIYPANGTYQACLITENFCGQLDTACQTITVNCPFPIANFSGTTSQLTATFADSSQNASNWLWDFGDGNGSTLQNPTHVYAVCDSYSVCLIVSNSCSQDTFCSLLIFAPTIPLITQNGSILSSSPALSYQWFLNGNPLGGDTLQSISPQATGYYQVEILDSNGCTAMSDSLYINPVGIAAPDLGSYTIFPNPTSGEISIAFSAPQTGNFEVYTTLGVKILSVDFGPMEQSRYTLSLSEISSGMYYLNFRFQDQWVVRKIELQR